jgi:hypothetical protein
MPRVCFTIAHTKDGLNFQPSCQKFELILKEGTDFSVGLKLSYAMASALQIQLANESVREPIIASAVKTYNVKEFEARIQDAAMSADKAFIEILGEDVEVLREETLLEGPLLIQLQQDYLCCLLSSNDEHEFACWLLKDSPILGIRKLHCSSPHFMLAMNATHTGFKTEATQNKALLIEITANRGKLIDLIKQLCEVFDSDYPPFEIIPTVVFLQQGQVCHTKLAQIRPFEDLTDIKWAMLVTRKIPKPAFSGSPEVLVMEVQDPAHLLTEEAVRLCLSISQNVYQVVNPIRSRLSQSDASSCCVMV